MVKKSKRKAPPAAAPHASKDSGPKTKKTREQPTERVNVDDLKFDGGPFFLMRSEMNDEQRQRFEAYSKQVEAESEQQERDHAVKWDAKKQFKSSIINRKASNKNPDGNKMKGYTVWTSEEDPYDRGVASKEFDSTWTTKSDANDRARYIFYWKNCFGSDADEVDCEEETEIEGLKKYTTHPADSNIWTVGVAPDVAFKFLDGAVFDGGDDNRTTMQHYGYGCAF